MRADRFSIRSGEVVADKYVVKNVIGRGGAGVVVAADHKTLRCEVALKFLHPETANEPEVLRRFLREAHAAARLRSEHVVRVMDAGSTEDGTAYLVMELLDGRDFSAVLKEQGPLPVPMAVDYLMQACEAVAEAHSVGIVHRDLKPANLFLTRRSDGKPLVKVLDFGLSKVSRPAAEATLTVDDHVMGSPHFMSPEQMRSSRDADARSDIWSLGVILYTFLAGRVPFEGMYLTEICSAVLSGNSPPLTSLRADVPRELAAIVDRCLRPEPDERFQSVAELAAALARVGVEETGMSPTAPETTLRATTSEAPAEGTTAGRRPRRRPALLALAGLGVALGTTVALHFGGGARPLGDAALGVSRKDLAVAVSAATAEPSANDVPSARAAPAAPSARTAAAEGISSAASTEPQVKRPTSPRRPPKGGTRRTASTTGPEAPAPTTTAPAETSRPKTDQDVILSLPH